MLVEKGRILIIDDEASIRDSCKQALEKQGNQVTSAENGDLGLQLFREFKPDVVLLDLKMPGREGIKVLEELERTYPNVVKIVITGFATLSSAIDAIKKGAYDFIPKPFTPDEIRLIVSRGMERRRLLLEREALRKEQEQLRRNMISLVSHELRAPLAATVQYLEVILEGITGNISQELKELISSCDKRLKEMLELVGKWMSLATFDPEKMAANFQDVHLSEVAQKSIVFWKPLAAEKQVRITLDCSENLAPIKGSELSLAEILNNLINNAIKYNKQGGRVEVKIYELEQNVCLRVQDNGLGIDEEHLPRIFDEFYRVDGRRNAPVKGFGLGLSIVKKLVDSHGGLIDVESRAGKGTTFSICFPKSKKACGLNDAGLNKI